MNKQKILLPILLGSLLTGVLTSCNKEEKEVVTIYTAAIDYVVEYYNEELTKKFPEYEIRFQTMTTGNLVERLSAEGTNTDADIFWDLEVTNAEMLNAQNPNLFADLSDYDTSHYLDDCLKHEERHKNYHIFDREAGCIIYNTKVLNKVLEENGLEKPTSYEDLLDPAYKGLIMMPNPKTSGTGYYFYKQLVENMGEEEALKYFEKLNENVKEFSSSGSGPVKSCDRGEIAIGLGMTLQAALYKDNNEDLEINFFKEGSPFTFYTMGMINGKQTRECVKRVYDYTFNEFNYLDNARYVPDQIYKDEFKPEITMSNWPVDIKYSQMGDIYNHELKQQLLDKWKW